MLISLTPSPSLQQGEMPTWKLAPLLAAHAYKVWNGVHRPSGIYAHQQHSTTYDSDGSESDSSSGHSGPCWCCPSPTCWNNRPTHIDGLSWTSSLHQPPLQFVLHTNSFWICTSSQSAQTLLMPRQWLKELWPWHDWHPRLLPATWFIVTCYFKLVTVTCYHVTVYSGMNWPYSILSPRI